MKSIKEKAEESSLGYDEVQAPAIGRGFVLGANYVLDEIETITKADLGSYKSQLDRIKNVIEQLKK